MTPEDVRRMTHEERLKLAASMAVPIRCGGTEYVDGVRYLRLGGWLVPNDVVRLGWPAIREYQATHKPYVARPRRRV